MDLPSATQLKQKNEYHLVYKLHPFEIDDDDPVDFVAVSRNNSLVELRSGRQIAECNFDFSVASKCASLSVFQSYNPTYRHYLFMNDNSLVVVVKRDGQLTVRDVVRGVTKFSVADRYYLGKPQVVVEMVDGEIEVFDFSGKLFASKNSEKRLEGGVKLKVLSQIQMLRTRVKSAEELLREKTQLVNKYTKSVLMNANNIVDDNELLDRNIPVIGSPIVTIPKCNDNVLEVGSSWVKKHDNQWVIGFRVMNLQEIPLTQFQLFAFSKSVVVKESLLFCQESSASACKVEFYSQRERLDGYQTGFVVGVLEEPHFIQPTVKFECMVLCLSTTTHQTYLSDIVVNFGDLNKLSLFEPDLSFTDLITIQATNKKLTLGFESDNLSQSRRFLLDSLLDHHKFLPINDSVIVNTNKDSSYYSLMIVKNMTYQSNDYCFLYKEVNQMLMLLHGLRKTGRYVKITPTSEISSWTSAKNALKEELTYIQNILINELTEENSEESEIEYSVDHLLKLQMSTAKKITSLR